MFYLIVLIEKYRESQMELHCVFEDLEKVYDREERNCEEVSNGRVCEGHAGHV